MRLVVQLVTIATFVDVTEAHLAKNLLESEGIEAFLADEYRGGGGASARWSSRPAGLPKLQVAADHVDRATQLLEAVKKRQ
jgi:hypothetical protein